MYEMFEDSLLKLCKLFGPTMAQEFIVAGAFLENHTKLN